MSRGVCATDEEGGEGEGVRRDVGGEKRGGGEEEEDRVDKLDAAPAATGRVGVAGP